MKKTNNELELQLHRAEQELKGSRLSTPSFSNRMLQEKLQLANHKLVEGQQ